MKRNRIRLWILAIKVLVAVSSLVVGVLMIYKIIVYNADWQYLTSDTIINLFSFSIGFFLWGTIQGLENSSVPTVKEDIEEVLSKFKVTIEKPDNFIERQSEHEAFSAAKRAIQKAKSIFTIGVVKDVPSSSQEKKDYLEATIGIVGKKDSKVDYRRIMSHNFSDDFLLHLKSVLQSVADFKISNPRVKNNKNAEIIIGTNFCLPYSCLIVDDAFLMISLNYPGKDKGNESYLVSSEREFVSAFKKHFEELWNGLKKDLENESIIDPNKLSALRNEIAEVSNNSIAISRSLYKYPRNDNNFSLKYAIESLNEIAGFFSQINMLSYKVNNNNKTSNINSIYTSFFAGIKEGDSFDSVTSVDFWTKTLDDYHSSPGEDDFVKESEKLLEKDSEGKKGGYGVTVRRVLLLDYYLPDKLLADELSVTTLTASANNIKKWVYWINAKRVIQHHIQLMIKYPLSRYDFKLYFVKQDGVGPLENKIGHYAILKTINGDVTVFEVEKSDSKEVQSSLVKTLTSTHRANEKAVEEVTADFSKLIKTHQSNMHVITQDHIAFVDTLIDSDDIRVYLSKEENCLALLGPGYKNPKPSLRPLILPGNENASLE
jgi:hypothetical protein